MHLLCATQTLAPLCTPSTQTPTRAQIPIPCSIRVHDPLPRELGKYKTVKSGLDLLSGKSSKPLELFPLRSHAGARPSPACITAKPHESKQANRINPFNRIKGRDSWVTLQRSPLRGLRVTFVLQTPKSPVFASVDSCEIEVNHYRGTSLMRKRLPLGPYGRPMRRALTWSWEGFIF
jgi:hypothetical protein